MRAWLIDRLLALLAWLASSGTLQAREMHPVPELPTDADMVGLTVEVLAGRLCGDRTQWFAGAIRHHAGNIGQQTMRAILFEVRRAMQDGSTERPHVLLGILIRHAEHDLGELGNLKT